MCCCSIATHRTTDISCIGEVNPDKFGAFTPGTLIPIVPEAELLARKPDYLLVLPWHFRAVLRGRARNSRVSGWCSRCRELAIRDR